MLDIYVFCYISITFNHFKMSDMWESLLYNFEVNRRLKWNDSSTQFADVTFFRRVREGIDSDGINIMVEKFHKYLQQGKREISTKYEWCIYTGYTNINDQKPFWLAVNEEEDKLVDLTNIGLKHKQIYRTNTTTFHKFWTAAFVFLICRRVVMTHTKSAAYVYDLSTSI